VLINMSSNFDSCRKKLIFRCSALTSVGVTNLFEEAMKSKIFNNFFNRRLVALFPKPAPKPQKEKTKECLIQ
jgi:hypothetical protein